MAQSNTAMKGDMGGGQPDALISMLNSFLTQMSGTNYNMNQAAQTIAPPRQPGGMMPGGMMVQQPSVPPMPEPNPMMHPGSPLEYDLGAMFRSAMMPPDPNTGMMPLSPVPPEAIAMGEQPTLEPPLPTKKPPAKPQRTVGKGEPSKTEPKQVTPPPRKKKMVAEK